MVKQAKLVRCSLSLSLQIKTAYLLEEEVLQVNVSFQPAQGTDE